MSFVTGNYYNYFDSNSRSFNDIKLQASSIINNYIVKSIKKLNANINKTLMNLILFFYF